MTASSMDACCRFTMTQLLSSQKKALRWCLGNIHLEPSRSACIPEEDFRKILLKRGEFVHARKTRLSLRDNWIVPKAQEMLQRLIRKELSLHLGIDAGRLVKMQLEQLGMDYSVSRWR